MEVSSWGAIFLNFRNLVTDIGVDLGTASVLVYVKNQGIVIREPSVVALQKDNNKILAVGEEARHGGVIGETRGVGQQVMDRDLRTDIRTVVGQQLRQRRVEGQRTLLNQLHAVVAAAIRRESFPSVGEDPSGRRSCGIGLEPLNTSSGRG